MSEPTDTTKQPVTPSVSGKKLFVEFPVTTVYAPVFSPIAGESIDTPVFSFVHPFDNREADVLAICVDKSMRGRFEYHLRCALRDNPQYKVATTGRIAVQSRRIVERGVAREIEFVVLDVIDPFGDGKRFFRCKCLDGTYGGVFLDQAREVLEIQK